MTEPTRSEELVAEALAMASDGARRADDYGRACQLITRLADQIVSLREREASERAAREMAAQPPSADTLGGVVLHMASAAGFDTGALTIAHELREHIIATMGDAEKGCDSGSGDGVADLWPWIGGREWHIQIKASRPSVGVAP